MRVLYVLAFGILGTIGFMRLKSFFFRPGTILNQISFTLESLKKFNGQDDPEVYISYNRKVYNVSSVDHYRKGVGSYSNYSGAEMAWALVNSDLEGKLLNIFLPANMTPTEKSGFEHWEDFYQNKYPKIGYLVDSLEEEKSSTSIEGQAGTTSEAPQDL